jgi:hypothetical protein
MGYELINREGKINKVFYLGNQLDNDTINYAEACKRRR